VVTVTADSAAPRELVREQVARMLSLDVDGSAFASVGARDPVAAELMRRYRGLRPVCFHSAYEAACWAIIGNRIRMPQAAALKTTLAKRFGEQVSVDGVALAAFPAPQRLVDAGELPGLSRLKQDRLRSVAAAAMDGTLLSRNLREQSAQSALATVQRIPGIGPFSAELILVRGAGAPDWFPGNESRLHDSMAKAYGVAADDLPALTEIARKWAPFRSWVSVLLRVHRAEMPVELSA
jgi:DNA-3-methyladenine glycosylase II